MDYNARFYSPYLNRFVQPDSIVPNLANPQSLNRYSYTQNNPINFIDPSGHYRCTTDDCVLQTLTLYDITTSGMNTTEKEELLVSTQLTGEKLAELGGGTPWDEFKDKHGVITITVDPLADTGGTGNCLTEANAAGTGSDITCKIAPDIQNTIHEFAHAFDNTVKRNTGSFASDNLPGIFSLDGFECQSAGPPCLQHSWVTYPDTGYTLSEAYADLYTNWILDDKGYENGLTDKLMYWYGAEFLSRGDWMDIMTKNEWFP